MKINPSTLILRVAHVALALAFLGLIWAPVAVQASDSAPAATGITAGREFVVTVTSVTDGDTLTATVAAGPNRGTKLRIRLAGIDAPETAHGPKQPGQPLGNEAKAALTQLLRGGQIRVLVVDVDRYRRAVACVYVGDAFVNETMVRRGMAYAYHQYIKTLPAPERERVLNAEREAKRAGVGVWGLRDAELPADYRRRTS